MKKLTLRAVVSEGAGMRYNKTIMLSNGVECCLRNGTESDGQLVLDNFNLTHSETDYLLTYPDENSFNAEQESQFLKENKVRHRAEFGISVAKKYWGLGIGKALLASCIECAKAAGYSQLELNVVAENERAVSMYEQAGFVEFGRNPKGFCSRIAGFQEVISMRLEL